MNRIIISLAMLLGVFAGGAAQSVTNNPYNKAHWGVRLSYELACPGDVKFSDVMKGEFYGNSSGVSFGAVYNLPVIYNFYFEPGITIAYNTYSINRSLIDGILDDSPELSGLTSSAASVRMWHVRVPLIGGYRFDVLPNIGISVFTGPELSLGLKATNHIKLASLTATDSAYGDEGNLNRPDVKWRFGAGITINHHFYGSISGAVGLCDQAKDTPKMHSGLFDITVGYNF